LRSFHRFLLPQTLFSEGVACQSHTLKAAEFMVCRLPCAVIELKNRLRAMCQKIELIIEPMDQQ
jgi:hypothetical protein